MNIFCAYKGKYPNGFAMANRLRLYAKALCSDTFRFTVASEGQIRKQKAEHPFLERFDGHSYWHWRTAGLPDRIPILRDLYASLKRWKLYRYIWKNRDIDVVFSAGYSWPQMLALATLCHASGKKYCIELNELPHSIVASRTSNEFTNRIKRWITLNIAFPRIDGFIVISENLKQIARQYASTTARIVKVPILTDTMHSSRVQQHEAQHEAQQHEVKHKVQYEMQYEVKHGVKHEVQNSEPRTKKAETHETAKNTPFIFHAGTLTIEKDGILDVIEGFAKCVTAQKTQPTDRSLRDHNNHNHNNPRDNNNSSSLRDHQNLSNLNNLRFEFSNQQTLPSIKSRIHAIIDQYGIHDRITFHQHLSPENLDHKFRTCSLIIINKPENLRNRHNFSTKLGECMSYGLPIITTAPGDSRNYLRDRENCLMLPNNANSDDIARHITTLINDPDLAATLGQNAKTTAENHFAWPHHRDALRTFFTSV